MPFENPRQERILDSQEKEHEVCKKIEELPLFEIDRMFILLTYFREKPASSFRIGILKDASISEQEAFLRKKEAIENVLKKANLFFTIKETEDLEDIEGAKEEEREPRTIRFFEFDIAVDENTLKELQRAYSNPDQLDHKTLGKLFGYPESAVKAYVEAKQGKREMTDFKEIWRSLTEEERNDFKKEGVLDFLHFTPSVENWREELETVRKWQKIVKEKAPRLYEEIRRGGYGRVLWTGD